MTSYSESEKMENISVQPTSLLTSITALHLLTDSMVEFGIVLSLTFLVNSYSKIYVCTTKKKQIVIL